MSAILGRVSFDGAPVDRQGFRFAFDALCPARTVRSDWSVKGSVALGHHDSGLDLAAPQPVIRGSLTLVADAALYNRDDLARALDCSVDKTSTAELILEAYLRWGAAFLQRINGDFGIAIYDADKGELFLARDHIGARPLFWTKRGNEVLFATFLHGLTAFNDLRWPLSETRIARYLFKPHDHPLESFLDGVEAVGPGQWLRISAGQVTRQCWWDPDAIAPRTDLTSAAAQEELRALTEAAVRSRLPRNAPVGTHFSGGIDSTLVTILASKALQARGSNLAAAYTWSPPVGENYPDMGVYDERRLIAAQCEELGVPARFGAATPASFEALIMQPMELQGTADLADELPVIAQGQLDGIGVMLSGWGGDEVFSTHGNGHLAWLLRQGRLREVLRFARLYGGGLRRPHHMLGFLWRAVIVPMLPDPIYRRFSPFSNLYGGGVFPSASMRALYHNTETPPEVRLLPDADAYMRQLLKMGHIAERMATWAAWSTNAGFEYRYPLADRHLLEFLLSLPPDIRFGDGTARYLAWHTFRSLLPRGVKKDDLANEKLRLDNRLGWWHMLAEDTQQGRLDASCPWLDMHALKATICQEPPSDFLAQISAFARFYVAMRIHAMYTRASAANGATSTNPAPGTG
ncbi:MAG: asparagine synthetase B family protein [Erythrobacter sp.]